MTVSRFVFFCSKNLSPFSKRPSYGYNCSFSLLIIAALVIPPPSEQFYGSVGIILTTKVFAPTHKNGDILLRMYVKVQGRQDYIDPFDFTYGECGIFDYLL